ncbi:MAG: NAD+ synthase [Bacteroidota bacterium]|nr:NAD+ synthase [Bacteroidota bacterium]
MNVALAQINYHIGNFSDNCKKIKDAIEKAKEKKADLIVFSELAVCGYPPRDFLDFTDFIDKSYNVLYDISELTDNIAVIIGSPSYNKKVKGKHLFNSAFFIHEKEIKQIVNKTLLPTYDIFDEYRYFEPNDEFNIIDFKGHRIALTICEDLWNIFEDGIYKINPMDELSKLNPDLIINISASPFSYIHDSERERILVANVKKYKIPLVYVNHIGAQTEMLFDGGSMVINSKGVIVEELDYFKEDFRICNIDNISSFFSHHSPSTIKKVSKIEKIHDALVMGLRNYFEKQGFKKAVLGLSGGIDSAVVLVLAERALGKENVLAVLMPSKYSSDHSVSDAIQLAENLGVKYETLNIQDVVDTFENTLQPVFNNLPHNVTEENIQARTRGVLLMGLSNKFGYILLNTSNKSELAVGYGTLYGDMCGGLSVIGDVYKSEVFELANFINKDEEIIPLNTIIKPPSAELRPDQKDSDSLPDYSILDKILYEYIELHQGPREIINSGYEETLVKRILKLVNTNEYKRYQTPPILRVSPKAFGMGRRLPIVAKYLS